jgi:hypothetical protein
MVVDILSAFPLELFMLFPTVRFFLSSLHPHLI